MHTLPAISGTFHEVKHVRFSVQILIRFNEGVEKPKRPHRHPPGTRLAACTFPQPSQQRWAGHCSAGQATLAEMLSYASDLTSMTQGRGTYAMEMSHYDIVPQMIADKIVAAHKPSAEEEEED